MKTNKRHLYGLIITLFFIGMSLFVYRHFVLDVPLSDSDTVNSWEIEANFRFDAERNMPVKASFTIPHLPPGFVLLDDYFVAQNYGVSTNLNGYNRRVVWSLRRSAGPQSLYYRAVFRSSDTHGVSLGKPPLVRVIVLDESKKIAAKSIIALARQSSADIQTFAQSTITALNAKDGNAKLLVGSDFGDQAVTSAAVTVLNQAKIPAMPAQGVYLSKQNKATFKWFLAVFNDKEWVFINPRSGATGLPKDYLVWQYGDEPMYDVIGGKKAQFTLTVSPTPINALSIAKAHGLQTDSQLLRFSLLQLPVNVQETYKILLMVPVGAFVILLLRNFIGLRTFGTFMPVLIALAFRETRLVTGITLFIVIVSFGLLARFYLEKLRLLLVPRLAAILTVVILLMIFISVLCHNLGFESGLSIALFPMVILTMTIERMCITWDERGAFDAIKSGMGSLLAAVVTFGVMNFAPMEYLIFAFPELLLVLLAVTLWFGQYRGYRVLELLRFKVLAGNTAC